MSDIKTISQHITETLGMNGYTPSNSAPVLLYLIGALIHQVEHGRGYPMGKETIQLLLANAIQHDQESKT